MTLAEFLLARIVEDEEGSRHWTCDCPLSGFPLEHGYACQVRIFTECQVKRAIIKRALWLQDEPDCTRRERHVQAITLDLLASVYASHPDYDATWGVTG